MSDQPAAGMAWAVDAVSRQPVYVGSISRARTGLACGCVCPACGARLQAVGAGHDARAGKRVPFFRHHRVQQEPGCKFRVAELAALRLLAEHDMIEIPAPRKRGVYVGASGDLYSGEHVGNAIREPIVARRMVSSTEAVLTLESGREVVLVLRGHQDVGALGSVFAVIAIHVDDSEVAWMSPEEIIGKATLRGDWLHLVKHADDGLVQDAADEDARQRALEAIDASATELNLPPGATKRQISESLLHWAIKESLLILPAIRGPEHREHVSARGSDGVLHTVDFILPESELSIRNVRAEILFEGFRPDIVCMARDDSGSWGDFELLIEVAVTHSVEPKKRALIQRRDLACLEIDVSRFAQGGRITRTQLRELVARDVESKEWIHHPRMAALREQAQSRADAAQDSADRLHAAQALAAEALAQQQKARARLEQERLEREQLEATQRARWAQSLTRAEAMKELRRVLEQRRNGAPEITSNGMRWKSLEFDKGLGDLLSADERDSRELGRSGIACRLAYLAHAARNDVPVDFNAVAFKGYASDSGHEKWAGLVHLSIDHLGLRVEVSQQARHSEWREMVLSSLRAGERTYIRPQRLDELLCDLFPELLTVLAGELGTSRYCDRVEQELAMAQERERLAIAEQKAAEAREAQRRSVPEAVELLGFQWMWRATSSNPQSADQAVQNLSFTGLRYPTARIVALVRDGWYARNRAIDLSEWLGTRMFDSVEDVTAARDALEKAYLIHIRR